jgi:hypothetical protein
MLDVISKLVPGGTCGARAARCRKEVMGVVTRCVFLLARPAWSFGAPGGDDDVAY